MKPAKRGHLPQPPALGDAEIAQHFRGALDASSPDFSAELHAQMMRELRARREREITESPRSRRLHPWHIVTLAATAAAVVVLVAALAMLMVRREREPRIVKGPDAVQHLPPATTATSPLTPPRLSDAVAYIDPLKTRIERAPRAFFFLSAGRLQHYCLNQLRIFPSRPQRDPPEEPPRGTPAAG